MPEVGQSVTARLLTFTPTRSLNSNEVTKGELIRGNFEITPHAANENDVSVRVTDPTGKVLYTRERHGKGKFALTASEPGDYTICFSNQGGHPDITAALTCWHWQ